MTIELHDGVDPSRIPVTGGNAGVAVSLCLGRNLHVCVVEKTGLALVPAKLYGYDLEIQAASGTKTLGSLGLLDGAVPLGYVRGDLPGFVLPMALDDLQIAHASCRKSHGCHTGKGVDGDALPIIDSLIAAARTQPRERLQQLFLTGDQVYCDDVPAALLAALTSAGRELLDWGRSEGFPTADGTDELLDNHARLAPGQRAWFLHDGGVKDRPADAKGWTDYAANHLLFFSEFCAMYLFAWSPELWQLHADVDPKWPQLDGYFYSLPPAREAWPPSPAGTPPERKSPGSPDTTKPALVYAQTLPLVRRALANVATYMVFDDHDVTDDWFLNEKVMRQLRGRGDIPGPGGRRMMRNALAAYTVFQHWGNSPEQFATGTPGRRLFDLLDADVPGGTPIIGQEHHEQDADVILDVGAEPVGVARREERMRWDYELVFDRSKGHRVIVLDTRTWRGYPVEPEPVDARSLHAAGAQRVLVSGDWGPEALASLAEPWRDAAVALDVAGGAPPGLAAVLETGAALLEDLGDLADSTASAVGTWQPTAARLVESAVALLDAVHAAPALPVLPWVRDGIGAARAAVQGSRHASAADVVAGSFAVNSALSEGGYRLQIGISEWLRISRLDALSPGQQDVLTAMLGLAGVLNRSAAFLAASTGSLARAAGHTPRLLAAWTDFTVAGPTALWGTLDAEVKDVLAAARLGTDAMAPLFAAAVTRYATLDPVWTLINRGPSRLSAELISAEALAFQVHERVASMDDRRPLTFVVSPAPVFGHWLVELAQQGSVAYEELKGLDGAEKYENEPWSGHLTGWARFLDALLVLEPVVFLSGDVHYAFSSVNEYRGRDGREARFVQLTASASKNAAKDTRQLSTIAGGAESVKETRTRRIDFSPRLLTRAEQDESVRGLAPAQEDVFERTAESLAPTGGRAPLTLPDLTPAEWIESITSTDDDPWERHVEECAAVTEEALRAVVDLAADQTCTVAGDRLQASPLAEEQILLLYRSLGIDIGQLEEVTTTMLVDPRLSNRFSGELALNPLPQPVKDAIASSGRLVVGRNNVGVISSIQTRLGRMVVHSLYYFPIDEPVMSFAPHRFSTPRTDWIVTRHIAALDFTTPPDGAQLGVLR